MSYQPNLFDTPVPDELSDGLERCSLRGFPEYIDLPDAQLYLYRQWLPEQEARTAFTQLWQELAWEQSVLSMYGRKIPIPRLNAWYGDAGCHYGYSGQSLTLHAWHPLLEYWRQRLRQLLDWPCNSVLANAYRDGDDSVAWHSDDEAELGRNPTIASISLGAGRKFCFKHKQRPECRYDVYLHSGDLLVMAGETQTHWLHQLPKSKRVMKPRINLTYRAIFTS